MKTIATPGYAANLKREVLEMTDAQVSRRFSEALDSDRVVTAFAADIARHPAGGAELLDIAIENQHGVTVDEEGEWDRRNAADRFE